MRKFNQIGAVSGNSDVNSLDGASKWQKLKEVVFRGRAKQEGQSSFNAAHINPSEDVAMGAKFVRPEVKEAFAALSQRGFDERDEAAFLASLDAPIDEVGEDETLRRIMEDPLAKDIASTALKKIDQDQLRAEERDKTIYGADVPSGPIDKMMRSFPTPLEFARVENEFLSKVASEQPKNAKRYQIAMRRFKNELYGKRHEYFEGFERLKNDSLTQMLYAAKLDGDPFIAAGGRQFMLSKEILEQKGLAPEKKITVDNVSIGFSRPYEVNGHNAVVAYVQSEKGTKAVSYYRSNSQGVWRLLPDYIVDSERGGTGIRHFGKGYTEEMTVLPEQTQVALERHLDSSKPLTLASNEAEFVFAGLAKRYYSANDYIAHRNERTMRGDFYQEVSISPSIRLAETLDVKKSWPESLDIQGPLAPDFSRPLGRRLAKNNLYGQLEVYGYKSLDGQLNYNFSVDKKRRAFISNVEMNAPIGSDGVRTRWAEIGDFSTPLYEYARQSDGYGDPNDYIPGTNYISMWPNYLSKMPIIQKFLMACSQVRK